MGVFACRHGPHLHHTSFLASLVWPLLVATRVWCMAYTLSWTSTPIGQLQRRSWPIHSTLSLVRSSLRSSRTVGWDCISRPLYLCLVWPVPLFYPDHLSFGLFCLRRCSWRVIVCCGPSLCNPGLFGHFSWLLVSICRWWYDDTPDDTHIVALVLLASKGCLHPLCWPTFLHWFVSST